MTGANLKRVLVVDDEPSIRTILATVLTRAGLDVDVAAGGREALELLREQRYSVILLDLMMPVVDGFDVLSELKHVDGETPPVVLVITGADRRSIERLDARRIHGVVRKPFDPDEVASIVAACVEIKRRNTFEAMALATMMAGGPILAILQRLSS
jgi:DNA-binding response OmpR family regulator